MEAHADLKTGTSAAKESDKSLHAAAIGIFTLPHLQSLELEGVCLDDAFFVAMTSAAPHAQVLVGLHIQTCQKHKQRKYPHSTDWFHSQFPLYVKKKKKKKKMDLVVFEN